MINASASHSDRHNQMREIAIVEAEATLAINAAKGEGKDTRTFSMVAYTGGLMQISGYAYPLVVDLDGLDVGNSARPIFLSHSKDVDDLLGQTTKVQKIKGQLLAEGDVLGDSPRIQRVVALADKGFAWQASIGASPRKIEYVGEGKVVKVNGQEFEGPIDVIRKSVLGEISFVPLGADDKTSALIATGDMTMDGTDKKDKKNDQVNADAQGDQQQGQTVNANAATPDVNASAATPGVQDDAATDVNAAANDAVAQLRAAVAGDMARIGQVQKICAGQHPEIEAKAISEGWDVQKTELEVLRASRPNVPNINANNSGSGVDTPLLLEAAACLSGGLQNVQDAYPEQVLEAADRRYKRSMGLQELILAAAHENGWRGTSLQRDIAGGLRAAMPIQAGFSSLSLSGILGNVANKFLLEGFTTVEDVWRQICSTRNVKDFKQCTSYRLTGAFEYDEVGPDGELKHGTVDEESYTNQAKTYGKMFAITRQDIINDDMGALSATPRRIGRGGALKLNDVFWTAFLNNSTFFKSGNNNYESGASTALSIDSLTAAELLFRNQVDADSKPLGVQPAILLTPTALATTAWQLMNSLELRNTTASKKYVTRNPYAGRFTALSSAYMHNTGYTGYSTTAWYLLADPKDLSVIEVAFLNGVQQPTVEQADADFNVLGIQMRGYFDFGVAKQDYRGGVKEAGA